MLLQALYSIRSERPLMERLDYDLLFRWFVGIGLDDPTLADLLDDDSIEITFAYHNGDEAILKANRGPTSTAC